MISFPPSASSATLRGACRLSSAATRAWKRLTSATRVAVRAPWWRASALQRSRNSGARSRPAAENPATDLRCAPVAPGRPSLVERAAPARERDHSGGQPVGEAQLHHGLHGLFRREHVEQRGHPEQATAFPIAIFPGPAAGVERLRGDREGVADPPGRKRREARQHHREEPGRGEGREPFRRVCPDEEPRELLGHPLAGDEGDHGDRARDGIAGRGGQPEAQLRHEAHAPQRAETVLGEAFPRISHRPDHLAGEVGPASERIAKLVPERVPGHGVHGEVTPGQVGLEVLVKGDPGRPAPVQVTLLPAEGGDLHPRPSLDDGHGPVVDPGRDHLPEDGLHLARGGGRGDVELAGIVPGPVEEEVADHAPDQPGAVAGLPQPAQHAEHRIRHAGRPQPWFPGAGHRHFGNMKVTTIRGRFDQLLATLRKRIDGAPPWNRTTCPARGRAGPVHRADPRKMVAPT